MHQFCEHESPPAVLLHKGPTRVVDRIINGMFSDLLCALHGMADSSGVSNFLSALLITVSNS